MISCKRWLYTVIVFSMSFAVGCSGRESPVGVTGEVTLDGTPIPEGIIQFEPVAATEGQRRDAPIKQGAFALPAAEGVLPDLQFKVVIKAFRKTGRKYPNADMSASYEEFEQYIPARYNSESTLHAEFSTDERDNHLKFDLVSRLP